MVINSDSMKTRFSNHLIVHHNFPEWQLSQDSVRPSVGQGEVIGPHTGHVVTKEAVQVPLRRLSTC